MKKHLASTTLLVMTVLVTPPLQANQSAEVGTVQFSNSCSPESQQPLNHTIAVLHSFWHTEAIRLFSQLIETNKNCAIAYWGLAMSYAQIAWGGPPTNKPFDQGRGRTDRRRARRLRWSIEGLRGFLVLSVHSC